MVVISLYEPVVKFQPRLQIRNGSCLMISQDPRVARHYMQRFYKNANGHTNIGQKLSKTTYMRPWSFASEAVTRTSSPEFLAIAKAL